MTPQLGMSTAEFSLNDRLASVDSTIAITGLQAVVRATLDQKRADALRGLNTAGFICGYRGSPVGGMDQTYEQNRAIMEAHDIRFLSGVNEELAATAVWGTQLASLEPNASFDGVIGMWYGKGPGLDRSGDAIRHAATSGVSENGGVLAVAGDDPANKSSTIPSASEWALADLAIPVLFPGNVQEVLDYGRFGYELSRFCGSWAGMKFQTNVADAYATIDPRPERLNVVPVVYEVDGRRWSPTQSGDLIGAQALALEAEMFSHRLRAAEYFVNAQGLDRIGGRAAEPARLGIVAAGTTHYEMMEALSRLGVDSTQLRELGIRTYKPAMIWPLEPDSLRDFATGLEEIFVIEEKRPFIESQIRSMLYGRTDAPRIVGKNDEEARPLVPVGGSLVSDDLLSPLRGRLARVVPDGILRAERQHISLTALVSDSDLPDRTAHFCSGCPHNRSTVVPEGSVSGGGIGCHGMAIWMQRGTVGITQMGGEGAQWVGMEQFVGDVHRFQNLGDGTLFHSGSMAIRQAIAAESNITYKVLYNHTVAMTGGQDAAGEMGVPELTQMLEAEGVVKTVVVSAEPDSYPKNARWASNSRIEDRDSLDAVQRELREIDGVTVLIYDQGCAAELRRGRKRATLNTPTTRVMIDSAICEGCGDCGEVSNCSSVHPIATPFGRKTQIHQESCNFDLTCLDGNCPAFVTVEVDPNFKPGRAGLVIVPPGDLPPEPEIASEGNLLFVGIGGTGVVTMSQVVSTAALLDGRFTNSLDQTGLAQKGGTVVSNLRISSSDADGSNYVGRGQADTLLLFDLVSGVSPKNLARAGADRTTAVLSTGLVPTGAMVSGREAESFPELSRFRTVIDRVTKASDNVWLDAGGIAQQVFASQPLANALVLGVAYQRGLIPVTGASIEHAMELNGVAVKANIEAFRLGRRIASDPELLNQLEAPLRSAEQPPKLQGAAAKMATLIDSDDALSEILAWRIPELIAYQDKGYAKQYCLDIRRVRQAEMAVGVQGSDLSQTIARQLFKLMAYKDEYEVARLALKSDLAEQARARFGPEAKISYRLKPPTLQAAGYDKKISIPETAARAMFQGLSRTKRLRGKRLDPFGHSEERKTERALIGSYRTTIDTIVSKLSSANYEEAVALAQLADQIRGYDTVKMANVERYEKALADSTGAFLALP